MGSNEEDLELVKNSILRSRSGHMSEQITDVSVKKNIEKEQSKNLKDNQIKSFEQGYQSLYEEIKKQAIEGHYSKDEFKPIPIESFQITDEKMSTIKKMIADGESINEICDFSTDVQLLFYALSLQFSEEALYEKSINAFIFLTTMNPDVQAFWIGLGLAYEKNLNQNKAIESFESAIKAEPDDFYPFYGIIRCCETMKDYSKLEGLLELAKENEALKQEALEVLEYLKAKK